MPSRRGLSLYRRILRLTKEDWIDAHQAVYVRTEAREGIQESIAFAQSPQQIEELFQAADQRIELAIHYMNPYPRLVHQGGGGAEGLSGHKTKAKSIKGQRKRINVNGATQWLKE
jgi:hypothetical protein